MKRKIIFIFMFDLLKYPPLISLINSIDSLGYQLKVLTLESSSDKYYESFDELRNTTFDFVYSHIKLNKSLLKKVLMLPKIRRKTWKLISKYYDENTIIWVVDEISIKVLGKKILKYKYILQLMELREKIVFSGKLPIRVVDEKKLGNNALSIVTCEYNRAHITRALWKLSRLPYVLPNKPSFSVNIGKNSKISDFSPAKQLENVLNNKKVILYQGICCKERPLDSFINAVDMLGDDYAFVLVSNNNPYSSIKTNNFYYIPFVKPPFHLEITSHAYIGILSYTPDSLNTLYCAPNKVWEYSKFGVPMLSNDLPSLYNQFSLYSMGICVDTNNVSDICKSIKEIENNYDCFSNGSKKFYSSVSFDDIVRNILEDNFAKRG